MNPIYLLSLQRFARNSAAIINTWLVFNFTEETNREGALCDVYRGKMARLRCGNLGEAQPSTTV